MGFKELSAFNLAMLGKQAWRFLTDPGSLVAKVYKARYYPTTSFTDATIDVERINMITVSPEYEDSWYWMSDPKGIYTVKNAYRHIVGDYENNPADFDKWVAMWKIKVPPSGKLSCGEAYVTFCQQP
ncbi:PREDICTED: uncharacterized protein LOC109150427 [Ipomoea nil]|uniref:uncharacterized protein LOC109150427 n=1 Tax=Ipomoea nil TaxID=35883 RepID=UPI000900A2F9|nr:PREDICTED: uncharacterized protein LOC109150427 [Ipomoea nil]